MPAKQTAPANVTTKLNPTRKYATLTAWSYSVYTQYTKCPRSVCFEKIERVRMPDTPNEQMERGNRLHKEAERAVLAPKMPTLSVDMFRFKDLLADMRKKKAVVEQQWAFTKQWLPTGWFSDDCWLRIKVDACTDVAKVVTITDYKTGKIYPDHRQQRSLYGLGGLQLVQLGAMAKGAKDAKVIAQHLYLDGGATGTETYTMKDLEPLKREWTARTREMLNDTKYPIIEGRHCTWCRYRKSNGGPCSANQ